MKTCTKCGIEKDESEFSKDKRVKIGLKSWCKKCDYERNKKYRSENPEKVKEWQRKWRSENPEKVKKTRKKWDFANYERVKENSKKWRSENPEKVKKLNKKWRSENPEKKYNHGKKLEIEFLRTDNKEIFQVKFTAFKVVYDISESKFDELFEELNKYNDVKIGEITTYYLLNI